MIKFDDFSKTYRNTTIIKQCSFELPKNKIVFFMGPNGAGKTTLIKCISGLETYSGTITTAEKNMLVLWDDCPFYDNISGINNLLIMTENNQIAKDDIWQVAKKYFTPELLKRKVKTYSYGQRKKLALVLQILLNPSILIMDEISNGLDYDSMKQLKRDIAEIAKDKSVILTGHQFSFYEDLVQEVFIIKEGEIKNVTSEYSSDNNLEKIYERYFE